MPPKRKPSLEKGALAVTQWVGSTQSLVIHTIVFILSFVAVMLGLISFDRMLLVLTTAVSLEAIYLAIFIQISLNQARESLAEVEHDVDEIQEDVGEIQEDIDEIQEDVSEIEKDVDEIQEDIEEDHAPKP
jgi:peptidoglycan hydrolase CwlO-like protein